MVTGIAGKGRAASPIRPGLITKRVLSGELPLSTGEVVTEACVSDLFGGYKTELDRVNQLRPREKRIRGMRYSSFYTMFRFAQLLGLVEFVREEEADFKRKNAVTSQTTLLRVDKGPRGGTTVRISNKRVFRLTSTGEIDEKCWSDLTNAWKQGWACGEKIEVEYVPPVEEVVVSRPARGKPTTFTPFQWREAMTTARVRALIKHLYTLNDLGVDYPGVEEELRSLSRRLGDWIIDVEDKRDLAEEKGNQKAIDRYEQWLIWLEDASEDMDDLDIDDTIDLLENMIRS